MGREFLKSLVLEVISLFGAERCMLSSNYHINSAVSDSDGIMDSGPSAVEMFSHFQAWVGDLSEQQQNCLFSETAAVFYRL